MSCALLFVVLGALAAGLALTAVLLYRCKMRRTLESISRMLDAAMDGSFSESHFDESLLSAVETKLADYLSSSEVSARNLSAEKDKIKELVGDISHQTKTPIANILLYSELLREQELPESAMVLVEPLNAQAKKLRFLIDALVKTSRLENSILTLHPERNPVSELVKRSMAQALPSAREKGIDLSSEESSAYACFDMKWTAEALYNLLDNAVKYTPAGGSVSVRVTEYELFCRVSVRDSGIGIAEDEQAKIFGRFYRSQATADESGVGIGLYLARQIAAGESGYLKLVSAPGQGSEFSLFLPRDCGQTKEILQNRQN